MAKGRLAPPVLTSNGSWITVYTVPTDGSVEVANITINLTNLESTPANLKVAVSVSATIPSDAEIVDLPELSTKGSTLIRACMLMSSGEKVMVYSDSSRVSVRVEGLEQ